MIVLEYILLVGVIVCAIAAPLCKRLLASVIVYMALSLMMAVLWSLLQSPDLAITEAAVGAGVTSILFFLTLKKIDPCQLLGHLPGGAEVVRSGGVYVPSGSINFEEAEVCSL